MILITFQKRAQLAKKIDIQIKKTVAKWMKIV